MYEVSATTIEKDGPRWCPVCAVVLKSLVRNEVEMDYCPQCHGVWLDQGELDILIHRSVTIQSVEPATPGATEPAYSFR